MALLKRAEFCTRCGIDLKHLSTYHKRGKFVYSGDYIDDSIEPNRSFIDEQSKKSRVKKEPLRNARPLNKEERELEYSDPVFPDQQPPNVIPSEVENEHYASLELEKKTLEVKKLKEEIQKLKLGNNKTQGNFVSIEAVKGLFVMYSETVTAGWEMAFDNFVMRFGTKNSLSRDEMLEMKSSLMALSNDTKVGAIENTKKQMRRLQTEASNQRGKGERL